jgi:hypothetical protein
MSMAIDQLLALPIWESISIFSTTLQSKRVDAELILFLERDKEILISKADFELENDSFSFTDNTKSRKRV